MAIPRLLLPATAFSLLLCFPAAAQVPPSSIPIERALSGAYFDPTATGQGLFIEVATGAQDEVLAVAAPWFTFSGDQDAAALPSEQRWYLLFAEGLADPSEVELTIFRPLGGRRDLEGNAELVVEGTATMLWTSCDDARMHYQFANGASGDIQLVRITPGQCSAAAKSITDGSSMIEGARSP